MTDSLRTAWEEDVWNVDAGFDMLATMRAVAEAQPGRHLMRIECSSDTHRLIFRLADAAIGLNGHGATERWRRTLGCAYGVPIEINDDVPFGQFKPVWS